MAVDLRDFDPDQDLQVDSAERTRRCAGVLIECDGRYLLCKRKDGTAWETPAGGVEAGESAADAAIRECEEEIGVQLTDVRKVDHAFGPGVFFEMFYCEACPTRVRLNGEFDDWGWFGPDDLPEHTHPQTRRVIAECSESSTEWEVAQAIAQGALESPQRFGPMWLFAVRMTGTGVSYRDGPDEWVYRDPRFYLNDEFLARCAGVPVIFQHPEKKILDSDEFRERSIGTVILGFVWGTAVWCVVRIYDDDAATLMLTQPMSTSPSISFGRRGPPDTNVFAKIGSDERMLIEGDPVLIDHLAICNVGVWDKGNGPTGILIGERVYEQGRKADRARGA